MTHRCHFPLFCPFFFYPSPLQLQTPFWFISFPFSSRLTLDIPIFAPAGLAGQAQLCSSLQEQREHSDKKSILLIKLAEFQLLFHTTGDQLIPMQAVLWPGFLMECKPALIVWGGAEIGSINPPKLCWVPAINHVEIWEGKRNFVLHLSAQKALEVVDAFKFQLLYFSNPVLH